MPRRLNPMREWTVEQQAAFACYVEHGWAEGLRRSGVPESTWERWSRDLGWVEHRDLMRAASASQIAAKLIRNQQQTLEIQSTLAPVLAAKTATSLAADDTDDWSVSEKLRAAHLVMEILEWQRSYVDARS